MMSKLHKKSCFFVLIDINELPVFSFLFFITLSGGSLFYRYICAPFPSSFSATIPVTAYTPTYPHSSPRQKSPRKRKLPKKRNPLFNFFLLIASPIHPSTHPTLRLDQIKVVRTLHTCATCAIRYKENNNIIHQFVTETTTLS